MYQVPVCFSSKFGSNLHGSFLYESLFGATGWSTRHRTQRYRLQQCAGLMAGLSVLLALAGCGTNIPTAELTAAESSVDFGAVTVGQASSATVSLKNNGTTAVQVSQLSITGQPFKVASPGSYPVTVAAGSTYSFQVQFSPSAAGQSTGQITVAGNETAGGFPVIGLSGLGVQPPAGPSPTSPVGVLSGISCSNLSITGTVSDPCTVTLTARAANGGVSVSLVSSAPAVTVPNIVTIPANATSANFQATATAVTVAQAVELWAMEDSIAEAATVQLNAAVRTLSSSVNNLVFGDVALNTAATQTVTLTSAGSEPVTVASATLAGSGYTLNGPGLPVILNPGQETVLTVQFDPTIVGTSTSMLTISSDDSSGAATVINLSGTGTEGSSGSGGSGGGGAAQPAMLGALSCSAASITGSATDSCNVTLTEAAPTGGVLVNLASNNPAVTLPVTVVVPAGATTIGFAAAVTAVASAETATLTATANGISQSFPLQLNAAGASLTANAATVGFGSVPLNTVAMQTLTLTSTGALAVSISGASVTGTGFTVSGITLPVTLNPGQSITLEIGFLPTVAGVATGQLTITSNATAGGTMAIGLSGTATFAHKVALTWIAPSSSPDPVVGYNVYRSPSGGSSYQLLNAGVNLSTTYTDSTVQDGQAYDYMVTSVDNSGVESTPSNTYTATIP
jgi:hypothetical protein